MNFEGSKDHLRGRNVVVGALWTMIIGLGSTVVDILTRDAGVLGSIPGPTICFQCIYMLIPPFVLHFVVCPAPGTDGLTPAIEGRTGCYFRGQRSFKEEGILAVVGAIRTVDTGLDGSVVELLTRVAGVPDTISSPADVFIVFICSFLHFQ